ncbi:hypothetical protein TbgDal_VIII3400 [Trypanosoma brucei gambiense DAL972]|uniref:Uncharacterized protein n=1 Tax=Trypanosoma brucei gambiense (strain MHOM/CI/86/DAL972) TaxID=679716 RepID=C9ZVF4_TRYB9|nr:hypothetical protein TbgDal_VIII3400 [Trypanosoma brucei gambiense DAL972]CBH13392.1 hypothetical protein TbgDal_VIII3400 [Trypanosoma brucei gambiense DAL972]|eukprot:XP_011775669.1 hypothetical protein TbgDal_VIII3400 [Trypanosoma brucei gambiense DAL972]
MRSLGLHPPFFLLLARSACFAAAAVVVVVLVRQYPMLCWGVFHFFPLPRFVPANHSACSPENVFVIIIIIIVIVIIVIKIIFPFDEFFFLSLPFAFFLLMFLLLSPQCRLKWPSEGNNSLGALSNSAALFGTTTAFPIPPPSPPPLLVVQQRVLIFFMHCLFFNLFTCGDPGVWNDFFIPLSVTFSFPFPFFIHLRVGLFSILVIFIYQLIYFFPFFCCSSHSCLFVYFLGAPTTPFGCYWCLFIYTAWASFFPSKQEAKKKGTKLLVGEREPKP